MMTEICEVTDLKFETEICKNLKLDPFLESLMVTKKSSKGHPIYSTFYAFFQYILRQKILTFNSKLRTRYPLNHTKTSAFLDLQNPAVKYYCKKFPENLYTVHDGAATPSFVLKPACCAHAFSTWSSRPKLLKKEILHQISEVYRLEQTGTFKSLSRGGFFTLPDYHLLTTSEDAKEDFNFIRSLLIDFYQDLLFETKNLIQVTRFVNLNDSIDLNSELLHDKNKEVVYYENVKIDPSESPYYTRKWELMYTGDSKSYTLATVQIDPYYPQNFKIAEDTYGPRIGVHFSMGSFQRIVKTLLLEEKITPYGLKVIDLLTEEKPLSELLELNYNLLIENTSVNLSQALSQKSPLEKQFFPFVLLRAKREWQEGKILLINRLKNTQEEVLLAQIPLKIKELKLDKGIEVYYTKTLKL